MRISDWSSDVCSSDLDVLYDDPENPTRILITHRRDREEDTTYSDWTATTYHRRDYRGRIMHVPGSPDGVNPYGILPFVPLFAAAPDDEFWIPGGRDLIEAQEAINVATANLWRAIEQTERESCRERGWKYV